MNERMSQTVNISAWIRPREFGTFEEFVAIGDAELAVAVDGGRAHQIADAGEQALRRAARLAASASTTAVNSRTLLLARASTRSRAP